MTPPQYTADVGSGLMCGWIAYAGDWLDQFGFLFVQNVRVLYHCGITEYSLPHLFIAYLTLLFKEHPGSFWQMSVRFIFRITGWGREISLSSAQPSNPSHLLVVHLHTLSWDAQVISSEVTKAVVEAVPGLPNGGSYETKNYTVLCPKPGTMNVRRSPPVFRGGGRGHMYIPVTIPVHIQLENV